MLIRIIYILILITIIFGQSYGQTGNKNQLSNNSMDTYELSPETAHPNAKKLLTEEFYWSPIEESGPFGNDEGSDAFYGFREWRKTNQKTTPIKYLKNLINEWGYPPFDIYTLDTIKIKEYIASNNQLDPSLIQDQIPAMKENFKEMAEREGREFDENLFNQILSMSTGNMGSSYILGIDNAIIAVGFGQFILEGRINKDLKELTLISLERELTPILLAKWDTYKQTRIELLNKMILTIDKIEN